MEANEELHEAAHEARTREDKRIGLTMAVVSVLLAVSTMLGHRTHTESVYEANSEMAAVFGPHGEKVTEEFKKLGEKQRSDAENIRTDAEKLEAETQATERKAGHYDLSEIFFEIGIVLCSISLLSGSPLFWRLSFNSTAAGILIAARGAWMH